MNKGFENIIYFKSNVNEVYTLIKKLINIFLIYYQIQLN